MKLMDPCRRAAELITQAQDEPLGTFDRLKLKLHLSMCRDCRNVNDQVAQLRSMMRALPDDSLEEPPSPGDGVPGAEDDRRG
jgi:predicted anti-sigma-YlaC factor YlaD